VTSLAAPLLDLFYELRQRSFPLGISDYLSALIALTQGTGITNRADLVFICQILWAKSPEEQKHVAETLAAILPEELSQEELEALSAKGAETTSPPPVILEAPESTPTDSELPEPLPAPKPQKDLHPTEAWPPGNEATLAFTLGESAQSKAIQIPPVKTAVTQRQMKRAWRYYRRMCRTGPPVELDVQATIENLYRYGVFLKPILIPRRQNQARILILIDKQGSMIPFRRATEALIESAKQTGLARATILFFHDVPGEQVFYDPSLNHSVPVTQALSSFIDSGVVLVSDGGAARGNHDPNRLAQTKKFIERVRSYTPHVVWLNPTPQERWTSSTAGAIRKECAIPMFELDRAGLDAAVVIMKGSGR
jgi:uncharacterized protein with von Willebrand factor type A (vWA) domain